MTTSELTKYLKTAFNFKNNGDYKRSIDYFYKSLAIDNDSTEIMSELALLYSKLCRYDRAVSFYEQILQKKPEDNETKFKLARLLKITKDYNSAQEIFLELYNAGYSIEKTAEELFFILICYHKYGKVITLFNKYSKILKNSSSLYFVAIAHSELGNKNTAEEFFKKSFNNDAKNILPGIEIANRLLERGKTQEAFQLAMRLLKYSEDARIYYLLAEIEYAKDNIDEAIKYYSYAIKINPQRAQYYFKLAISFSLKGFFKEAEESYCKAINLDSENETYHYSLAYMYYIIGKYNLSEKLNDFILAKNPDNIKSIALKILIMSENNKNQIEGKLIEKLSKSEDKDDFIFYAESIYYSKLNLWEKAEETISKAIAINGNSIEYNYQSANFLYHLDKISEAKNICDKILEKNPNYIQAYLLLGKIHFKNHDYLKAINMFDKVIELDKNIAEAYYWKGVIYLEQKNYNIAIEKFKIAMSIAPEMEDYYAKIAECYFNLKKYDEAFLYFKEASNLNIANADYRYFMAKCSEYKGSVEEAVYNYSIMKRLNPLNFEHIKEFLLYLKSQGKTKELKNIIKSLKKQNFNASELEDILTK